MATLHPMGKFLTIKAIVFFSFWWGPLSLERRGALSLPWSHRFPLLFAGKAS